MGSRAGGSGGDSRSRGTEPEGAASIALPPLRLVLLPNFDVDFGQLEAVPLIELFLRRYQREGRRQLAIGIVSDGPEVFACHTEWPLRRRSLVLHHFESGESPSCAG